jgi:S1-C subfamily serine protease
MLRLVALSLPLVACTAAPGRAAQEGRLEDVFERVQGSVVTVYTAGRTGAVAQDGRSATAEGIGSGTLIDDEGHVLTASHVVQTADVVAVEFRSGERLEARVMRTLPSVDLALLKLTGKLPEGVRPVKLGDSDAMRVAAQVFVVGAPLGVGHTLTVGHLSARRDTPSLLGLGDEVEVLQTDAAINQGNSGGPLFNMAGEVVGVVSYIVSDSGTSAGLGFAVSSNTVREMLLERPAFWSGVDFVALAGDWARAFNLPDGRAGLLIQRVANGSAGARLGLRGSSLPVEVGGRRLLIGGDVVLVVAGVDVGGQGAVRRVGEAIDALGRDAQLEVLVLREGREVLLAAPMAELLRVP